MMHIDFAPLYRSSIGFDRLASLIENASNSNSQNGYPPYNIELLNENKYRITMAVAGFADADLDIQSQANTLVIKGNKPSGSDKRQFLYQGIAERGFERRFQLADYVRVVSASIENGLLHVDLEREIPEAMKPRKIEISNGTTLLDS
ncbi:Hsp20 family protein [Motiliproteus sp. MSK22-1]|uniref:Hsp20 family protein n=1 Tax=Motiliproteus sp. MSK22-1 TaxID=1897630 RepID=UPI0018E99B3A|nr:Hsp20 family protein [Motiliproteus sp. MSK22-1]